MHKNWQEFKEKNSEQENMLAIRQEKEAQLTARKHEDMMARLERSQKQVENFVQE